MQENKLYENYPSGIILGNILNEYCKKYKITQKEFLLLGEENNTNLSNTQKINLKNQIKDILDLL